MKNRCLKKILRALLASGIVWGIVLLLIGFQESFVQHISLLYGILYAAFAGLIAAVILIARKNPLTEKRQRVLYWLIGGGFALLTILLLGYVCQVPAQLFHIHKKGF